MLGFDDFRAVSCRILLTRMLGFARIGVPSRSRREEVDAAVAQQPPQIGNAPPPGIRLRRFQLALLHSSRRPPEVSKDHPDSGVSRSKCRALPSSTRSNAQVGGELAAGPDASTWSRSSRSGVGPRDLPDFLRLVPGEGLSSNTSGMRTSKGI